MTLEVAKLAMFYCRDCGAKTVWTLRPNGKWLLVNRDSIDLADVEMVYSQRGFAPRFKYGEHVPHFTTCPGKDDVHRSNND